MKNPFHTRPPAFRFAELRRDQGSELTRSEMGKKRKVLFLVGPTAVGKSAVAVRLARKMNAEIISCDSMQVYRGMDIVTSKPSPAQLRAVRHHLVGVEDPARQYNVSRYRREALAAMRAVFKRGKTPLFTGGTGLYMSVLLDGIFKSPAPDLLFRRRLEKEARRCGNGRLHLRLHKVDPAAADRIHPHDLKRIIRALEVFKKTGTPISLLQRRRRGLWNAYDVRIICLDMERAALYARTDARIERMFSSGLLKEARGLLAGRLSVTAGYAIGLRELKSYFDGHSSLRDAKLLMQINTRHYAKRQLTWFRKDKRLCWIKVSASETPAAVARRCERIFNRERRT